MSIATLPIPAAPAPREAERKVFAKRKRLPGPQWFERNINVPVGSRQGLYRNQNNPAMWGVLDWATRSHVRTVVLAKGIQIGGTLGFYGLLLREGEYTSDNSLIVVADERTLKKLIKKRLQKMIDSSPYLAAIKSTNPDDTTMYSVTLGNGFTIEGGWASSEVSVSSESYRIVILDEISKYKSRGNIEDAKSRTTVFPDTHKIWILSSPGIDTDDPENRDPLMVEAEACDVMLEFHATCPDCGKEQVMTFDRFGWPGQVNLEGKTEADPKAIRRNRSAWYQCEHCNSRWNDYKRDKAVLASMKTGWKPTDGEEIERPQSVYFHFPAWLSPYVSLSEVVASWLEAQGDEEKLRKWHNRFAGVSYKPEQKATVTESALMRYRSELARCLVPADTAQVWLLADTQQNSFYYQVWSCSYAPDLSLHMLEHGIVATFSDLEGLLNVTWQDHENRQFRISAGLIDSGGTRRSWQKHSRTTEVYEWCSQHRVIIPHKGIPGRSGELVSYKTITTFPGTNKAIPGGLIRANIRVDLFKDEMENRLTYDPDSSKALSFHCEIDEAFAKHYTTERKTAAGDWVHDKAKGRNDYFDCTNYALALREILKLQIPHKPVDIQKQHHEKPKNNDRRRW